MMPFKTKLISSVATVLVVTILPALSAVPKKQPLGRYAELWNDSPFTVKPAVDAPAEEVKNPLEDYTLAGACEMKGGWFVVLINKKDRNERIRLRPGVEDKENGFQVVKVENGDSYLGTKVEIQTRSGMTGTVEYDKKFIVLKKATPRAPSKPGAKPKPPVPGRATGKRPPVPSSSSSTARPSRVRRVPNPPSR